MPVSKKGQENEPHSHSDTSQVPHEPERPGSRALKLEEVHQSLKQARQRLAKKNKEIARLRAQLAQYSVEGETGGLKPENIVWIFGSGRTGSTWLSNMMAGIPEHIKWNEPLVGALLGYFYYERASYRAEKKGKNFILGQRYKHAWVKPVRSLVLGGAAARFPELTETSYLIIKEPGGSIGAPLLMEALPESRMILLVRDPRDVVASGMDARKEGSWFYERRKREGRPLEKMSGGDPNAYLEGLSESCLRNMSNAKQAYDAHMGRKVLVHYEDLRSDTLATMGRLYAELGILVDEKRLVESVESHAWENVPEEEKGEGKIRRTATPGGWREDLTPEQIQIVEKITAPLLKEFYPD